MKTILFFASFIFTATAWATPISGVLPSVVKLETLARPQVIEVDKTLKVDTGIILSIVNHFIEKPKTNSHGTGSGFFIREDGYIVTNAHVVRGVDKIRARLSDGRVIDGKIVGRNDELDIGLVKIEGNGYKPVTVGSVDKLNAGDRVFVIGSGMAFFNSVSEGIVSSKDRLLAPPFVGLIQTDAAVNPGNSGGGLFNERGEIVGIPTMGMIFLQGLSFCIPIDVALQAAEKIIAGKTERGSLAIAAQDMPGTESIGALVMGVKTNGAAGRAGLRKGDVVRAINGKAIKNAMALRMMIANLSPSETVRIAALRDGKPLIFTAKLDGATPLEMEVAKHELPGLNTAGLLLKEEDGKLVVETGAAWAVHKDDVVLSVNGKAVKTKQEFEALVKLGQNAIEVERASLRVKAELGI